MAGLDDHFSSGRGNGDADPNDPPLVSDVRALLEGAVPDQLSSHFAFWVEGLARMPVQAGEGEELRLQNHKPQYTQSNPSINNRQSSIMFNSTAKTFESIRV